MSLITKPQIRDAATAAIAAISIPQPTASIPNTRPDWPFREYPRQDSIRFMRTAPRPRAFQVEIGTSRRIGAENAAAVDKITVFRVLVAYPAGGDVTGTEDLIALDTRLIANALRSETNSVPLYPATDVEAEPERFDLGGQLVYRIAHEYRGQHSEAEWSTT